MAFHTRLSRLLGIEHPIIQGGMAWTATAELAAAVSNAGGLGIIGAGQMPTDVLRSEIRNAKLLTDKPFGVNLMLLTPHIDDIVEMVLEEGVERVTTGAGNPGKYMAALKDKGIKVLPIAPSVALAKRMESIGADAIIGEGMEAGGHIGDLTTMVLVPQLVDAVSIPVVAAGGIADGRGVAAAFALGAEGVQVGTRFMCADGVHHPPRRQGAGHQGQGPRHGRHRALDRPPGARPQEQALAADRGARPQQPGRGDRGARQRQARARDAGRRHRDGLAHGRPGIGAGLRDPAGGRDRRSR